MVFNINDMDAFERDHPNIKTLALGTYDPTAPYGVVGMSTGNEIRRAGMIGDVLDLQEDRKLDQCDALGMIAKITNLYEPNEFDAFDWGGLKEDKEQEPSP